MNFFEWIRSVLCSFAVQYILSLLFLKKINSLQNSQPLYGFNIEKAMFFFLILEKQG